MPHATPVPHATFLLVVAGIALIAVVAATMLIARRALRSQVSAPPRDDAPSIGVAGTIKARTSGPTAGHADGHADGVVRTLAERGLLGSDHLASMSPAWNISLFHYRNQGADPGRVLVGLQVPPRDRSALRHFLADLGYRHWDESDNPAYKLFLR